MKDLTCDCCKDRGGPDALSLLDVVPGDLLPDIKGVVMVALVCECGCSFTLRLWPSEARPGEMHTDLSADDRCEAGEEYDKECERERAAESRADWQREEAQP